MKFDGMDDVLLALAVLAFLAATAGAIWFVLEALGG